MRKTTEKEPQGKVCKPSYERVALCFDSKWNYARRDGAGFDIPNERRYQYLQATEPGQLEIPRIVR